MKKAPKEMHSLLDDLYNQIYLDRKKTTEFGTAKQIKMACSDFRVFVPITFWKKIYQSYTISLTESK